MFMNNVFVNWIFPSLSCIKKAGGTDSYKVVKKFYVSILTLFNGLINF